jgi:hypothetical protein
VGGCVSAPRCVLGQALAVFLAAVSATVVAESNACNRKAKAWLWAAFFAGTWLVGAYCFGRLLVGEVAG